MKLLIVEDIKKLALAAKAVLKRVTDDIDVVENAAAAQLKCSDNQYDAILMDFGLPDTNGVDLTAMLRRQGFKGLIIGLTANRDRYSIDTLKSMGLNACIKKPLRSSHLPLLNMTPDQQQFDLDKEDTETQPVGSNLKVVDFEYSLGLLNDPEMVNDVFFMFNRSLPKNRDRLVAAFKAQDLKTIQDVAHIIKGEAAYCGAPGIQRCIGVFHETVRIDVDNMPKIERELNELCVEIQRFLDAYPEAKMNCN